MSTLEFETLTTEDVQLLPPGSAVLPSNHDHKRGVVIMGEGPYFRDARHSQIELDDVDPDTKWLLLFRNTRQE